MVSQKSARLDNYSSSNRWKSFFRELPGKVFVYLLLSLWAALSIFAFLWVISTSLKTSQELFSSKTIWNLPTTMQWINYVKAWTVSKMGNFFINSIFVSVTSVLLIDVVASMAAYILGRFKFRGARPTLLALMLGMAIPIEMIMIPIYLIYEAVNINDSLLGLILIYTAISLPFSIFVLVGFFRSLPQELEEAAILDGASEYGVFWKVMAPLAMPGIITVTIFNFLGVWNEYMLAYILIKTPEKDTIPLGLYNLMWTTQYSANWTAMFAGFVIVMIPTILVFLLLQDRITRGMTVGALKG
jgi:N-acetylglucosamine transport system permease protein